MQHMRYQEFIENVKEHIKQELQLQVHVYPVLKNNDTVYDGLVILDPLLNISPTIYLNPYFGRYLEGVPLEDIYDDIIKTYHKYLPQEDFDISFFCDYEKAQEHIIMKLVNAKRNKELLQQVPHILVYDLALLFLCSVGNFTNEFSTILIHNHHLEHWNVTVEDLYEMAQINTPKLLAPRLDNLHDVFEHITNEDLPFLDELSCSILTNHLKIYGATVIVYPELLREIAEIYEDDLIIIPSSIHETLVIPNKNMPPEHSIEHINTMIQDVNETHLLDTEILSDHVYYYNREHMEITY